MSSNLNLDKKSLSDISARTLKGLGRYAPLLFLLLLLGVYGFVAYRIYSVRSVQPTQGAIDSSVKSIATPHIDQNVVNEMQSLQDHSVNVKTLFDQARHSPFQE